jgi:hypothetical protein
MSSPLDIVFPAQSDEPPPVDPGQKPSGDPAWDAISRLYGGELTTMLGTILGQLSANLTTSKADTNENLRDMMAQLPNILQADPDALKRSTAGLQASILEVINKIGLVRDAISEVLSSEIGGKQPNVGKKRAKSMDDDDGHVTDRDAEGEIDEEVASPIWDLYQ